MITTVTPNPSVDHTLRVATVVRGAVHRATSELVEPSGKGVNVAIALHAAGRATVAVLPVGDGTASGTLTALLQDSGVPVRATRVGGDVRSNVSVIEQDGTTTKFNAPGARLEPAEVAALVAGAHRASVAGQWLAWCGSLPAGFDESDLAAAVASARAADRLVALDTSGAALARVLAGPAHALPHLIKPNAEELSELVGRPLRTVGTVTDAARELVAAGVRTVLVSLGAAGAVLVQDELAWYGQAVADRVANTAGAGDAFLAGYLAAQGSSPAQRLACALRWGAAAVARPGTLLRDPPIDSSDTGSVPADNGSATDCGSVSVVNADRARDRPLP